MSNMNMKILINNTNAKLKTKNILLIDKNNIDKNIIPSFTKKIFSSISKI